MAFLGKGIDLGNACDISFIDGLKYFDTDSETKVVALHIEGMHDPKVFTDIAKNISKNKPVLALKTGKSEQAAKAAQSHTGSLTGSTEIWRAALKQTGIIQVADLEELIDLTRTFSVLPFMQKSKIGIATTSGGLGIMTIDACQQSGLEIDKLSPDTKKLLDAMAPPWLNVGNPLDIWPIMVTSPSPTKPLKAGLEILLSDKEMGAVVFIGAASDKRRSTSFCQLISDLAVKHQDKPLVACIFGPYGDEIINKLQETGKVVGFPTPGKGHKGTGTT